MCGGNYPHQQEQAQQEPEVGMQQTQEILPPEENAASDDETA